MSSYITTPIRCSLVLLIIALLVSGCSSSSDSNQDGSQSAADVSGSIEDTVTSDNGASGSTSEMEDATVGDTTSGTQAESTEGANGSITGASEPSIPDPLAQNSTRVEFSISVPAYQSDTLQVRLTWDTKVLNASWIGDELWAASDDFPTDTEHELVVTFSDANGDITLGQYENVFKTGTNDSEDFHVSAEQFNIDQWDNDEDGTTNIDELIAGTDPLVNEDSLLEIRDVAGEPLGFIADSFESRIPEERPYNEYSEERRVYHEGGRPPTGADHVIEISIDESGNGTLSDSREEGFGLSPLRTLYTGTRTHSENAIQWEGKRQVSRDWIDLYITTTSVNTVSIVDDRTRKYEETYRYNYDTSDEQAEITETTIDLVGEVIEGTSFCQPVTGMFESETFRPHGNDGTNTPIPLTRISIKKEIDDQYWRVKSTVEGTEPSETEYLARKFNSTFQCDFVEF